MILIFFEGVCIFTTLLNLFDTEQTVIFLSPFHSPMVERLQYHFDKQVIPLNLLFLLFTFL